MFDAATATRICTDLAGEHCSPACSIIANLIVSAETLNFPVGNALERSADAGVLFEISAKLQRVPAVRSRPYPTILVFIFRFVVIAFVRVTGGRPRRVASTRKSLLSFRACQESPG